MNVRIRMNVEVGDFVVLDSSKYWTPGGFVQCPVLVTKVKTDFYFLYLSPTKHNENVVTRSENYTLVTFPTAEAVEGVIGHYNGN